jgi:hypothetical protein
MRLLLVPIGKLAQICNVVGGHFSVGRGG